MAVAGKYQWDDRPRRDTVKDVQGEAVTKYSWSEGKNTVSIYLELDGLDDVTVDSFKAESGKTNVSLTKASVAGKQRIFKLTGLEHEITGAKVGRKTDGFPEAREEEEKTWNKLLELLLLQPPQRPQPCSCSVVTCTERPKRSTWMSKAQLEPR